MFNCGALDRVHSRAHTTFGYRLLQWKDCVPVAAQQQDDCFGRILANEKKIDVHRRKNTPKKPSLRTY